DLDDLDPLPAGAYRPDGGQRARQVQRRLQVVGERRLPEALRPDPFVAGRGPPGPGGHQLLWSQLADLGPYDQVVHPRSTPSPERHGGVAAIRPRRGVPLHLRTVTYLTRKSAVSSGPGYEQASWCHPYGEGGGSRSRQAGTHPFKMSLAKDPFQPTPWPAWPTHPPPTNGTTRPTVPTCRASGRSAMPESCAPWRTRCVAASSTSC